MNAAFAQQGLDVPLTPNQLLLDNFGMEGLEKLKRFVEKPKGKMKCTRDEDCRFVRCLKDLGCERLF